MSYCNKIILTYFICLHFFLLNIYGKTDDEAKNQLIQRQIYQIYTHAANIEGNLLNLQPYNSSNIKYYLYTENVTRYDFDCTEAYNLLNKDTYIVFLIHGWTENSTIQWYQNMTAAFLNLNLTKKYQVIQVDWSVYANDDYLLSTNYTQEVGYNIGDCIAYLNQKQRIDLNLFLLVAHSLGGQTASFVGKHVKKIIKTPLPRIVACDPAGPLFELRPTTERLSSTDAEVVEVIHTDGGNMGFLLPCGTIDFFANGGTIQPGCPVGISLIPTNAPIFHCSHHRSVVYFIEGLGHNNRFVGTPDFATTLAGHNHRPAVGDLELTAVGNYDFETNSKPPFYRN